MMTTTTSAPIMVRNTFGGPAVFTYGKAAEDFVEWAGAGDQMGGDIQPVPAHLLNNVQFRRALTRGIFVVEDDADIAINTENAHRAEWEDRMQRQHDASVESLDEVQENDILMVKCIAPAKQGSYQLCGKEMPVRQKEQGDKAPLCTEHQHMASQFVPEHTGRMNGNEAEVIWKKVTVAPRRTAKQKD